MLTFEDLVATSLLKRNCQVKGNILVINQKTIKQIVGNTYKIKNKKKKITTTLKFSYQKWQLLAHKFLKIKNSLSEWKLMQIAEYLILNCSLVNYISL